MSQEAFGCETYVEIYVGGSWVDYVYDDDYECELDGRVVAGGVGRD